MENYGEKAKASKAPKESSAGAVVGGLKEGLLEGAKEFVHAKEPVVAAQSKSMVAPVRNASSKSVITHSSSKRS